MTTDIVIQESYEILDIIGQGGFGKVYKVRYAPTGSLYAYKLISYINETSEVQRLIESEIKLTRHLSHPNIIKFHHVYHSEKRKEYHIVMDICSGGDLRQLIDKRQRTKKPFEEELIWLYIGQILLALAYLHCPFKSGIQQHGRIIHRDIKPANIFVKENNTLIVGDLGICKDIGRHSSTDVTIGTPAYMAPEVLMNVQQGYNEKSDIWSLGLIAYELCTFEKLVSGATVADAVESIRYINFPIIVEGYSLDLVEVLNGMIDPNVMTRFSAHDLLAHPRLTPYIQRLIGSGSNVLALAYGSSATYEDSIRTHRQSQISHYTGGESAVGGPKGYDSENTAQIDKFSAKLFNHTPLMIAAEMGDYFAVDNHRQTYAGNVNTRGYTALMIAAEQGHIKCVKLLLESEAGRQGNDGTTALIIAINRGFTAIAKLLVGFEASIKTYDNRTPLMIAVEKHNLDLVKLLTKYSGGEQLANGTTALMMATQLSDQNCVKVLTKAEAGLFTEKGRTALMFAAERGCLPICKILAKREAGLQAHDGTTAMMLAVLHGYEEVVMLLYKKEKAIHKNDGTTPYQLAARIERYDLMHMFAADAKSDTPASAKAKAATLITEMTEKRT